MTTRKKTPAKKAPPKKQAKAAAKRKTRPTPARKAPDRSGAVAAEEAAKRAAEVTASNSADLISHPASQHQAEGAIPVAGVDEAIADAVKSGYDVLAQSIAQGREAAARFRQGEYNMREVPKDVETAAKRVIDLARQISVTTFDLCEEMLGQIGKVTGGPPPPGEVASGLPPFRNLEPAKQGGPAGGLGAAPPSHRTIEGMVLSVEFTGPPAKSLTHHLARPDNPTSPDQISAAPLQSRHPGADAIPVARFSVDFSRGGLLAHIDVPKGQKPGIYAGLVFAEGQDIPLGTLVIEVEG